MKQIEIDSGAAGWFRLRDDAKSTRRAAARAETDHLNLTTRLAKKLLPKNPKPGERYIFPTTGGKAIVAFLKPRMSRPVDFPVAEIGTETDRFEPAVEEHNLNA